MNSVGRENRARRAVEENPLYFKRKEALAIRPKGFKDKTPKLTENLASKVVSHLTAEEITENLQTFNIACSAYGRFIALLDNDPEDLKKDIEELKFSEYWSEISKEIPTLVARLEEIFLNTGTAENGPCDLSGAIKGYLDAAKIFLSAAKVHLITAEKFQNIYTAQNTFLEEPQRERLQKTFEEVENNLNLYNQLVILEEQEIGNEQSESEEALQDAKMEMLIIEQIERNASELEKQSQDLLEQQNRVFVEQVNEKLKKEGSDVN